MHTVVVYIYVYGGGRGAREILKGERKKDKGQSRKEGKDGFVMLYTCSEWHGCKLFFFFQPPFISFSNPYTLEKTCTTPRVRKVPPGATSYHEEETFTFNNVPLSSSFFQITPIYVWKFFFLRIFRFFYFFLKMLNI